MKIRAWFRHKLLSVLNIIDDSAIKEYDTRIHHIDGIIADLEQKNPELLKFGELVSLFEAISKAYTALLQERRTIELYLKELNPEDTSTNPLLVRIQRVIKQDGITSIHSNDPVYKVIDGTLYTVNDFVVDYYQQHNTDSMEQTVLGMRAWVIQDLKAKLSMLIRKHNTVSENP